MKTHPYSVAIRFLVMFSVTLAIALFASAAADEPGTTIPDPGYRPDGEQTARFLETIGDSSIAVLPTLIRRLERTAHSFDSQQMIVDFLNENRIGRATSKPLRIDRGILERRTQWDTYNRGFDVIAAALSAQEPVADYILVLEILVPGDQAVFGIHVYILDNQARNAFSFLLNAHHELFTDAGLVASDNSEEARATMIADATTVSMRALQLQIDSALECARRKPIFAEPATVGLLHDFDSSLGTGTDEFGIPIGYSTFAGPKSRVSYSITGSYPPREGDTPANNVLRIDLDVNSWGGLVNRFAPGAADQWLPQDWQKLQGLGFWFHGTNSGAPVFFDVFDNRSECSRTDDAERFRYRFVDDVSGWREIKFRFVDLERWNVGNNAPNDGLGLDRVHGWGIGTSNSEGAVSTTFYVDDFRLLRELPDAFSESGGLLEHGLITELRLDDLTSRIEISTRETGRLVGYQIIDLWCACTQLTLKRHNTYFRIDEREILNGDRARFRLTFYDVRPTDVPVLRVTPEAGAEITFSMSAAVPADQMQPICQRDR